MYKAYVLSLENGLAPENTDVLSDLIDKRYDSNKVVEFPTAAVYDINGIALIIDDNSEVIHLVGENEKQIGQLKSELEALLVIKYKLEEQ